MFSILQFYLIYNVVHVDLIYFQSKILLVFAFFDYIQFYRDYYSIVGNQLFIHYIHYIIYLLDSLSQQGASGDVWIGKQSGGLAAGVSHGCLSHSILGDHSDVPSTGFDGYQHCQRFPQQRPSTISARTKSIFEIHYKSVIFVILGFFLQGQNIYHFFKSHNEC